MRNTQAVADKLAQVNRAELARELGLDRSYVSQVLGRKRMPGLDVAAGISKRVGVSLDQFHGWLVESGRVAPAASARIAA